MNNYLGEERAKFTSLPLLCAFVGMLDCRAVDSTGTLVGSDRWSSEQG